MSYFQKSVRYDFDAAGILIITTNFRLMPLVGRFVAYGEWIFVIQIV